MAGIHEIMFGARSLDCHKTEGGKFKCIVSGSPHIGDKRGTKKTVLVSNVWIEYASRKSKDVTFPVTVQSGVAIHDFLKWASRSRSGVCIHETGNGHHQSAVGCSNSTSILRIQKQVAKRGLAEHPYTGQSLAIKVTQLKPPRRRS